jgi:tripartite-type tricarboxylate transporter receptor subunit TctC
LSRGLGYWRLGEPRSAETANTGSFAHIQGEQLMKLGNIKLTHVPYKGSGQATTDLLAGTVPMSFPGTNGMMKHIKGGKLRVLATSGVKRSTQLPDVPTLDEAGLKGYSAYVWMGLLAPKGTPQAIVDKLQREFKASLASAEVVTFMNEAGIETVGSSPAEMDAYFREERDRWARIVRETGAKVD